MKYVVRLRKARGNLVPVKRLVTKRGKPFLQTFYMSPDTAPKAPEKPKMIAAPDTKLLPAPKPEWKGPLGDERAYVAVTVPGGIHAVRIPESVIHSRFSLDGMDFVTHRSYESISSSYVLDEWRVTEVTTGLKLSHSSTAESAEEAAKRMIENKGTVVLKNTVKRSAKIADVLSDNFIENPKVMEPMTNEDIQTLAEHIYTEVLDRGEPEEGDLNEIITWIEETNDYTTRSDVESALQNMDYDDGFAVDLAIRYFMDFEDAESLWEDLEKVSDYASEDIDTVMDWYERNYGGGQFDANLNYLGTSSDYGNEWSDLAVVEYALENDVTIETAQAVAEESTEEADVESRSENELPDMHTDAHGILWTQEEMEAANEWVGGGEVAMARNQLKNADEATRGGGGSANLYEVASMIQDKATELPYTELWRGTPKPAWRALKVGETFPYGAASFSRDERATDKFTMNAGSEDTPHNYKRKTVMVLHGTEENPIVGVDIYGLSQGLQADGHLPMMLMGYDEEQEVIVRCPSLKVTAIKDIPGPNGMDDGIRYLHVVPNEMELLDLMKSRMSILHDLIDESLNMSLRDAMAYEPSAGETLEALGLTEAQPGELDESDSVPTPES